MEDRLRVCMLAPSHPAWDPRVVQKESVSLAQQGKTVGVIAMLEPGRSVPDEIELIPLPLGSQSRISRALKMFRVYRKARAYRADVYHAHEVESLVVGILLKWRSGARLIFDAHECFHYTAARHMTGWTEKVVTWLTKHLLKILVRAADHVIVVSPTNENFYKEFCKCRNVSIVHNSPAPDRFPDLPKAPEAYHTVVHQSILSLDRGMDVILQALAIVNREVPMRFLNVGTIHPLEVDNFHRRVAELGLQDNVEVTGWLEYDRIGPELNRGAIGLLAVQPTRNNYATLHNKLLNYMSCGQAVVGPKGSDSENAIKKAHCGVAIDMTKPETLAAALLDLAHDPDEARRLGENGRTAIEEEYGWHLMEKRLEWIYASLPPSKRREVG